MKATSMISAAALAAILSGTSLSAAANSDWFQHAAISPDGKTILFSYKGDIYSVAATGGTATPLTSQEAWEGHPVWSHDGKSIAFASDRFGNLDVFVMPATGGEATRLTWHSNNDIPTDFSPDGREVLFTSARVDAVASSNFPRRGMSELYEVRTTGGTPHMVDSTPMSEARFSPDGSRVAYREEKAMESDLRKHDTSAFARDIWVLDLKKDTYTQVTDFAGGDHTPVWKGSDALYYLSEEETNNFNVFEINLGSGAKKRLSDFSRHPVRGLSVAKDGTLAYTQHGSIYTQKGGKPQRVAVSFRTDAADSAYVTLLVTDQITEFAVSPNGKEIAFVARGEVFVTSTDFATTRRITNTPEQERSVSFDKDGRTLLYTSSRGDSWKLYETSITDEKEKYFFAATSLKEKLLYGAKTESFQPVYSPDGKKVAFLSQRDEIQVLDKASGKVNVALPKENNISYSDGDISFAWSPDSKWLTADFAPRGRLIMTNIGVFPADGSAAPVDITKSGYMNSGPQWGKDGEVIYWGSSRYGMRSHGSWGRQFDVMATFLTKEAYDKFTMSKEEWELQQELEKDEKEKAEKAKGDDKKAGDKAKDEKAGKDKDAAPEPVTIDWAALDDRTVRLTQHSSDLGGAVLLKDASKLYYLARFEKGYDLWMQDFREQTTALVAKLNADEASITISDDDKTLFILADGRMSKADVGDKITPKPIAANAVMELKPAEERAHMFEHAWRKIKDKFYNPDMHGADWDGLKADYAAKLPSINNNRDLGRMMEELMGELNASHTGTYYRPHMKGADATASLGVIFDLGDTSGPITIAEVLEKGPLDSADSKIRAGMKLVAVDGVKLDGKTNLSSLLNNKAGTRVRLTVAGTDGKSFDEVMKPISTGAEADLLYDRWVKGRKALVEKLSGGRLGYVHVRGMNDDSYRVVYNQIMGENIDKEGLIVDTRWNGGGWLHNDLAKLLSGKNYLNFRVRGREFRGEPTDQWSNPSLIVIGEGNYSDAHTFPFTYKALDIGDAVGMPVPGTSTSVWWENLMSGDLVFGVPQFGNIDVKGNYLENRQIEPDYKVKNDPLSASKGEDKQIEKAVEVMLKTVEKTRP